MAKEIDWIKRVKRKVEIVQFKGLEQLIKKFITVQRQRGTKVIIIM